MFCLCTCVQISRRTRKVCVLICTFSFNKESELNKHWNIESQDIYRNCGIEQLKLGWPKKIQKIWCPVIENLADHLEGNSRRSQRLTADGRWDWPLPSVWNHCKKSWAKSNLGKCVVFSRLSCLSTSLHSLNFMKHFFSDPAFLLSDHPIFSQTAGEMRHARQTCIMFGRKISLFYCCLSLELSSIKKITVKTASLFLFFHNKS